MEFLDEFESRPGFHFQSKQFPQSHDQSLHPPSSFFDSLHKPTLLISLSFSLITSILAFFYFDSEPLKSVLLWFSLSLLIGPFAPPSLTAGDIRVGVGPPLKDTPKISTETNEKPNRKSTKIPKKTPETAVILDAYSEKSSTIDRSNVDWTDNQSNCSDASSTENKSDEWSEIDDELLKKLMGKHPPGKPGRWEAIAEGFKGKHKVETVIAKAKEMGERKVSDHDSYKKFLKDRKPLDKRALDEEGDESNNESVEELRNVCGWSSAEDLALLNALKAFPKDVAMRWEKIAASVPGKTKSACMKRVGELKKEFRSAKGSSGQAAS